MSQIEPYRRPLPERAPGEVLPPPRYETIHEWGEPAPVVAYRVRRPWGRIAAGWAVGAAVILSASCLPEITSFLGRLR